MAEDIYGDSTMDRRAKFRISPDRRRTRYGFRIFLAVALIVAVVFYAFPGIDIWVEQFFHTEEAGWFLRKSAYALAFDHGIGTLSPVLFFGVLIVLVLSYLKWFRWLKPVRASAMMLFLCLSIGAGIVVNEVLKENWGRARPFSVVELGGTKTHTPPFVISDQCSGSCSFVAGHPSAIFAFFGIALLFTGRRRTALVFAIAAFGLAAGFGRMIQGKHFLSDVIFSGVLMYLTAWCLHHIVTRFDLTRDIRGSPMALLGRGSAAAASRVRAARARHGDGRIATAVIGLALLVGAVAYLAFS